MIRPARWWLLRVLVVLAITAGGSLWLGEQVHNPRQLAAEARPPSIDYLTTPVQRQRVRQILEFSATTYTGGLAVPAVAQGDSLLVLTDVRVRRGHRVDLGHPMVAISGRPVIALKGKLPAYRDIAPDSSGPDVTQLRAALRELGYASNPDRAGWFGPASQAAVSRLYRDAGFEPALTSPSAIKDQSEARRVLGLAQAELDRATAGGVDDAAVRDAREARDEARANLSNLLITTGVMVPRAEVFFLPSAKIKVVSVPVRTGQQVQSGDSLVVLGVGPTLLLGQVDPQLAHSLKTGLRGTATDSSTGEHFTVRTTRVPAIDVGQPEASAADEAKGAEGGRVEGGPSGLGGSDANIAVLPARSAHVSASSDYSVSLILAETRTDVLAVPSAAVESDASGVTQVRVMKPDGSIVQVRVTLGISGDGFIELRSSDNLLVAGARVVIGRATPGPS